ncbi:hypothetical protein P175DRAFT_0469680 [Aspergillus ochraceoroseus IBT 24754]|uniref:AB hydrolase-1 domain-containing protein n=2 Tax=Aspergillus ochraceoroseus TaxID=138278 RepID=A0A2T5M696_9EURO|nr:uncharacterized protein P175DRAFT_0469680 [Aspergillus ochraceoroseus IBT 24754]KKK22128.1 hypothetical protein AOCH_003015 [Aspergillus ochraceoroseus]PTU24061.1 hypothetical protein P175DRAFT_0469680 [Aspergillus ochraceoroseus IBT 24754]
MPAFLPSHLYSFTIPSIYDGSQLDCRIYLPKQLVSPNAASEWRVQGAIVAHPYAPFGGCYDDPVVNFVGGELLDAGYIVGTFNFRGAGGSEGRTSWTARPELGDYASFYGFLLLYLNILKRRFTSVPGDGKTIESKGIHIVLGGYSYGSLVAQHLPAVSTVTDIFLESTTNTSVPKIFEMAKSVHAWTAEKIPTSSDPSPGLDASESIQRTKDALQSSATTISYLLISPVLPPVNFFLTLFSNLSLEVEQTTPGRRRQLLCPKPSYQLCVHRSLAIYGDEDTFTSAAKLRKWSGELKSVPHTRFHSVEIERAGHFWREDGVELQAREALRAWLCQGS